VLESVGTQLRAQGRIPTLPAGWNVDVAQHAAFGAAFSGDFISSRLYERGGATFFELVLVDVSGRGIEAGSRALLFSGAIGGLLGEVDPDRFLPSANDYLLRQHSESGFSSATYVHANLTTGAYRLYSAGHPPVIVWSGGERRSWRAESSGIVLGVVDDLDLHPTGGTLDPGDALVLYTDGVVEVRTSDLETGICALEERLERVERVRGTPRLAEDLLAAAHGNEDDQTVVVIWAAAGVGALAPAAIRT
jgi:serine phosphatase RsbU (regulator of sigma subunit)